MIIGLCGYGYTGSGAYLDLLREYEEISDPKLLTTMEFSIAYVPNSICDLKHNLVDHNIKHFSSDLAINCFLRYLKWARIAYDRRTNGKFSKLADDYLKSLIKSTYKCHRKECDTYFYCLVEKVLIVLQRKLEFQFKRYIPVLKESTRYIAADTDSFVANSKHFIREIIKTSGFNPETDKIILDQPFPPNDPEYVFEYFDEPFAIVVSRDPRDLYLQAKYLAYSEARFIPTDDYHAFCDFYKFTTSNKPVKNADKVLRLRFEDLIYEYDRTVKLLEGKLGIRNRINKNKFFNPAISIQSTNLKDLYPEEKEAISYIEHELKDYLFPFENYSKTENREMMSDIVNKQDYLSFSKNNHK